MYQENADSWYITMLFDRLSVVLSSDVPKFPRNLVHHSENGCLFFVRLVERHEERVGHALGCDIA